VFHLAAQPLVRQSYAEPLETYATNVMGTVNVLEAVRLAQRPCVVLAITTDKCYENREEVYSYQEEDRLGGHDPYSSSKAAAELVISAYRSSFFSGSSNIRLASVRAGNVLGGGDWALDRIVPDCIRALQAGRAIAVRNRLSTRPWQHVLEPLSGYLLLGAEMHASADDRLDALCSAFNFGPDLTSNRSVAELVEEVLKHWPGAWKDETDPSAVHEAGLLNLSSGKALRLLRWRPVWAFEETIARTTQWYRDAQQGKSAADLTAADIGAYMRAAGR
jgi:CDP-glucose 4,6-dehydratase